MRLYHYLAAKWGLEDLEQQRLKIATFDDMNDPFELMCYELPAKADRQVFMGSKEDLAQKAGVLCFSRTWKNPVLWSHYADRHRGLCLGFEVPDESAISVKYTSQRLSLGEMGKFQLEDLNEAFAHEWISTKGDGWSYEDEVRVYYELNERDKRTGRYYSEFGPKLMLKQVVAGPLFLQRARLKNALKNISGDIELIKARLAFKSYEVIEDKRGF